MQIVASQLAKVAKVAELAKLAKHASRNTRGGVDRGMTKEATRSAEWGPREKFQTPIPTCRDFADSGSKFQRNFKSQNPKPRRGCAGSDHHSCGTGSASIFDSLAAARSALAGLWLRPMELPLLLLVSRNRICRFRDMQTFRRFPSGSSPRNFDQFGLVLTDLDLFDFYFFSEEVLTTNSR